MANYKVTAENSTLGAPGTVVTDAEIEAAPANVELLVASGIVEPVSTPKKKED